MATISRSSRDELMKALYVNHAIYTGCAQLKFGQSKKRKVAAKARNTADSVTRKEPIRSRNDKSVSGKEIREL